jgi:hypothetical protein
MAVTINGSAGVTTNSGAVYNGISSGTAVASTSGTSIDFTSIPSWVKRITVMFSGVSTSGTSNILIQLGSSSVTTSGYTSMVQSGGSAVVSTAGFIVTLSVTAAYNYSGLIPISTLGSNSWASSSIIGASNAAGVVSSSGGNIALGGTLDRIRITTVNGTDTFDAGTINIMYE